jgi:hypothetical protein
VRLIACGDEVQLYAFDVLALDGDDLRSLPLSMRGTNLDRLLARRPDASLFRAACDMGLEGPVSKHWVKMLWGGRRRGLWYSRRSVQRHQWSAPCRNLLMRAGPSRAQETGIKYRVVG